MLLRAVLRHSDCDDNYGERAKEPAFFIPASDEIMRAEPDEKG